MQHHAVSKERANLRVYLSFRRPDADADVRGVATCVGLPLFAALCGPLGRSSGRGGDGSGGGEVVGRLGAAARLCLCGGRRHAWIRARPGTAPVFPSYSFPSEGARPAKQRKAWMTGVGCRCRCARSTLGSTDSCRQSWKHAIHWRFEDSPWKRGRLCASLCSFSGGDSGAP